MSPPPISCAAASATGGLALAVAVTGIVATMPYIALQLVGMQVVIAALGIQTLPVPGGGAQFAAADRLPVPGRLHLYQRTCAAPP